MNKILLNRLYIKFVLSFLIFVFSILILPYYTNGDQYFYNYYYTYVGHLNSIDWILFWSKFSISAGEPCYIFLTWIFSKIGFSHIIFVSIFNAMLTWLIVSIMHLKKINTHIFILLLLFNFYLMVFFFAAERLKFAIIFLMLYILYRNNKYSKSFLLLSVLSHFQIIIGYVSYIFKEFIFNYKEQNLILLVIISILIYIFLGQAIYNKAYYYISKHNQDINVLYKSFIFFLLSLYYSEKKKETLSLFIPLFIAIYLLGGDRLNVFAYFIFLYYVLPVNRGLNIGILMTSIYFTYKSIIFLNNIIIYGDGFYK